MSHSPKPAAAAVLPDSPSATPAARLNAPHARSAPGGLLGLAAASLCLLAALPFVQLGDGTSVPQVALFLGRFHPVLLHVPIGVILLAALFENARLPIVRSWFPEISQGTSTFLIFCAAASATGATFLGWMLSFSGGYDPSLLSRHFNAGLATAIGANLTLICALLADALPANRWLRSARYGLLMATAGVLGLAGHLGADITHGEDYLTEYAPNPLRKLLGLAVKIDPANIPFKPLPERIAFAEVVGPILTERCVGCHSGQKSKGGLRLDRFDLTLRGGDGGVSVLPGDPDHSELLRRINLPLEADKHMPPKGKTALTDDEITVLTWWIQAGAPDSKTLGELQLPEPVKVAIENTAPAPVRAKREAALREEAAHLEAALTPLRKEVPGFIRTIVPGEPNLDFSSGFRYADFGDPQLKALSTVGGHILVLNLWRSKITDAGLETLSSMPNLTRLELQETNVGDAGLKWVSTLSKLETLNLYHTRITDGGLAQLASLHKLRRLYLWDTAVTDAGEKSLRTALPTLQIVRLEPSTPVKPSESPAPKTKQK